jgi:hypothetical protein
LRAPLDAAREETGDAEAMSEFEAFACEKVQPLCPECGSALRPQHITPNPDPYVTQCSSCDWGGWAIDWRTLNPGAEPKS